jgi:hypothetical protein
VNQLGRTTGQAERLRTVTPHRLFLAIVSALAGADVESLADLLRTFNYQHGVQVAYKAFYNRLARLGFATFMRGMCLPRDASWISTWTSRAGLGSCASASSPSRAETGR